VFLPFRFLSLKNVHWVIGYFFLIREIGPTVKVIGELKGVRYQDVN